VRGVNEKHEPARKHGRGKNCTAEKGAVEDGRNSVRLLPVIYLNLIAGDIAALGFALFSSFSRAQTPEAEL